MKSGSTSLDHPRVRLDFRSPANRPTRARPVSGQHQLYNKHNPYHLPSAQTNHQPTSPTYRRQTLHSNFKHPPSAYQPHHHALLLDPQLAAIMGPPSWPPASASAASASTSASLAQSSGRRSSLVGPQHGGADDLGGYGSEEDDLSVSEGEEGEDGQGGSNQGGVDGDKDKKKTTRGSRACLVCRKLKVSIITSPHNRHPAWTTHHHQSETNRFRALG